MMVMIFVMLTANRGDVLDGPVSIVVLLQKLCCIPLHLVVNKHGRTNREIIAVSVRPNLGRVNEILCSCGQRMGESGCMNSER